SSSTLTECHVASLSEIISSTPELLLTGFYVGDVPVNVPLAVALFPAGSVAVMMY
ncbi:hypothetical protein UEG47_004479, partial [Salmonella enterica]|nr:hypothetical protein [Salmonella enterica]